MTETKNPVKDESAKGEPVVSRLPKWAKIALGVFAVIVIIAMGTYNWSVHHLVVGQSDVLVSSACAQGSTTLVIHPDGSGYSLEGDNACLGGNPKAGNRQDYRKGTFDYGAIQKAVAAAQGIKVTAACASNVSFLQVQLKNYSNPSLMCYGSGSTNDPSSDPNTQKLNNLSDQILVAQSKANL